MSNYSKLNNITGWLVFAIATAVYVLTLEPTASFWDCGEFIAAANKLQVPHPPGAPFFLLIGRIFSLFASDVTQIAYMVNLVSALSSSLTILFLFWTITMLARKMVSPERIPTSGETLSILGAGVIGALAFTFSDSFWFSAEEAEVYAMSSFFTAFVFWAILKWENNAHKPDSDKWLILMAYMVGLSIGVHLLNLVALPAVGFVYYFKRYQVSTKGIIYTMLISGLVIVIIMIGIIPGLPSLAGKFELYFVNDLGFAFNSGMITFIVLLIALLTISLILTQNEFSFDETENKSFKNLFYVLSGLLILFLGLAIAKGLGVVILAAAFVTGFLITSNGKKAFYIMIRTAVVLFIAAHFFSQEGMIATKVIKFLFVAGVYGAIDFFVLNKISINNQKLNIGLLSFAFILIGYASYGIIPIRSSYNPPIDENDPENLITFVSYLKREQYGDRPLLFGPFYSADRPKYKKGDPIYRKDEKQSKYVIYHYKEEPEYKSKDMRFLPRLYSTQGSHINAYKQWLNLKPNQKPTMGDNLSFMLTYQIGHMYWRYFAWNFMGRESDVEGAGTIPPTQWFANNLPESLTSNKARNNFFMLPLILGLIGLIYHYMYNKKDFAIVAMLFFFTGIAIILYLNQPPIEPRERDYTYTGSFYAFSIWIGLGVLGIAELLRKMIANETARAAIATILCISVPGLMAAQGWDDHDRSKRYHSVDSAKNLLESCAKNAVLFTGGDNDTFPLWYVQEVEGFRTDVRVCNLSLLNTDWYIEQMKKKAYDSKPLPITLNYENFIQGTNDYLLVQDSPKYLSVGSLITAVRNKDPEIQREMEGGTFLNVVPSKKLFVPVNKEKVKQLGIVPAGLDSNIVDVLEWTLSSSYLEKKDLIILDMIANGNWERPIYFSTTLQSSNFLNLKPYMQLEGLAFRLLPVKAGSPQGWINSDIMYDNMMHKFAWRNLDDPSINYDENFLRFPSNARHNFMKLAEQLYNEGKIDKAREVMAYSEKVMPDKSVPYDWASAMSIPMLFKLKEDKMAMNIVNTMGKRAEENLKYYLKNNDQSAVQLNATYIQQLMFSLKDAGKNEEAKKYEDILSKYEPEIRAKFKFSSEQEEE
jgi:hypothetical protein